MKTKIYSFLTALIMIGSFTTCKKDKPDDPPSTPPPSGSELKINDFSPKYGVENMEVTIVGTGFKSEKAQNQVKFGDVPVTEIISATPTELKVKVPVGTVKSKISVIVNNKTALSAEDFKVFFLQINKTFGGNNTDYFSAIAPTIDGGFVAVGSTTSSNNGDIATNKGGSDAWIVRVDNHGTLMWSKTFGGIQEDNFTSVIATSDGGFIAVGSSNSNNGDVPVNKGSYDAWVVKIDRDGNLLWSKTFGGSDYDNISSIIQAANGGVILAGNTTSTNQDIPANKGNSDGWIIKLNEAGAVVWSYNLGGSYFDALTSVTNTADGSYIAVGYTESTNDDIPVNKGGRDAWIIKFNENGVKLWSKTFGGTSVDNFNFVRTQSDGSFIVAGQTKSTGNDLPDAGKGANDGWVMKISAGGDKVWSKIFGGTLNDGFRSLTITRDGDIAVVGETASSDGDITIANKGSYDVWLLKLDGNGNKILSKTIGGSTTDVASIVLNTSDNYFVISGSTDSNANGDVPLTKGVSDGWVIKMAY